jgi:phospho-N-acetylmuramoyl-pentapeptide-transferase
MIPYLIKFRFGQYIRQDGPASHIKKAGTPTMGGIMIIISFTLAVMFITMGNPFAVSLTAAAVSQSTQASMSVVLAATAFGVIGFMDDYIKKIKKRSLGLRAYQKLIGQIIISILFTLYWQMLPGYSTEWLVPFFPGVTLDLGFLTAPCVCLVFLASTNGANLTDGLDGLATGVTAIMGVFFLVAASLTHTPLLPAIGALIGSLLGFLLFNGHPARVIMGDTGSLALGGFVAAVAVQLRMPLFLFIVGAVYVMETLSVIIQVGYFKLTKGKRFFKMAPIHHTFELSGWGETKIVTLFYVVTAVAVLVGIISLSGITG